LQEYFNDIKSVFEHSRIHKGKLNIQRFKGVL